MCVTACCPEGGRLTVSVLTSADGVEVSITGAHTSVDGAEVFTAGGRLTVSMHTSANGAEVLMIGTCTSADGGEVLMRVHASLQMVWKC